MTTSEAHYWDTEISDSDLDEIANQGDKLLSKMPKAKMTSSTGKSLYEKFLDNQINHKAWEEEKPL